MKQREYFLRLIISVILFSCSLTLSPNNYDFNLTNDNSSDPGDALFLTPLIAAGKLDEAKKLSLVGPLLDAPNVTSYAGLLTVNKKYNSNMYFWFIPALANPDTAPVLLWLDGGPGSSSLFSFFVQNGPFIATKDLKLHPRKYAWTNEFSILYVDNPVGTGYSFTEAEEGYATNQDEVATDLLECLKQFFTLFSNFQKNDFYIAGESYAGKYVPSFAYKIHQDHPKEINLKGIAIGDGLMDPEIQIDYGDFLYHIGLLDENQRDYFMKERNKFLQLLSEKKWKDAFDNFDNLLAGANIFPQPTTFTNFTGMSYYFNILQTSAPEEELLRYRTYISQGPVRKAMHVGNLTYNLEYTVRQYLLEDFMQSVTPKVAALMDNYKVLIYSGQLDIINNYPKTVEFIQSLQWKGAEDFKKAERKIWKVLQSDSEVAGYVRQVGNFYEVMLRNAGHLVSYYQPRAAFDLITRFVAGTSF